MQDQDTLARRYNVQVSAIAHIPRWYWVRFYLTPSPPTPESEAVPEALVVVDQETSLVGWNEEPHDATLSQEVFEAEACQQATAEHQKRHAL